jgi:hypothetical protein
MEKEGSVLLIHDESCPVSSAIGLVDLFNKEMKEMALN